MASIAESITAQAKSIIDAEHDARSELAHLASVGPVGPDAFEPVMVAAANSAPWRDLLAKLDEVGLVDAVAAVRNEATTALIEGSEVSTPSVLWAEQRRLNREGLRSFLRATNGWLEILRGQDAAA